MARGIDHLVVAGRDLDTVSGFYERLGFRVGGRNRHPWGTENRIVQVQGSFIELISLGTGAAAIEPHSEGKFSFGAFVRDYLSRREGLAMLVLDSENAGADAALFAETGIGRFEPFFFERRGQRPDGSETHVAFTLAFARDEAAPQTGFFVCQHHHPESFWNPEFQDHPNEASAISTVVLAAPEPALHASFLTTFTGVEPKEPADDDLTFVLTRGRIDVATEDDAGEIYGSVEADPGEPCFVAFGVRVRDLNRQAARLTEEGIPFQHIGSRLVVPASVAFGVAVAFEPE